MMASGQLYQIVFDGTLTGKVELNKVKQDLAAMFKMNATQVEALFSGKPIVIKRNVDEDTARKYENAFFKVGAKCSLVPAASAGASAAPVAASSSSKERATGREVGKDIVNKPVPTDLGGLSMGKVGENIPTQPAEANFELPDLSNLSMNSDESYIVTPSEQKEPQIDISGLSAEDID